MKNLLTNTEFQLDEILFEHRNKQYGAYALRNEADAILTRSMLFGLGLFVLVAGTPLVINAFKKPVPVAATPTVPPTILTNVTEIEKPPVAPVVIPQTPKAVATYDSRVPTPTANPKIEKVLPKQSDPAEAIPGTVDVVGDPPVVAYTPPAVVPAPPAQVVAPVAPPVDNTPKTVVDVQASFVGGINTFRNKVISNFDASAVDNSSDILRTTVIFIVERDGTISEVKATGNNSDFNRAAERTIRSVKGKWVPAKINGQNVRSYFKFPISMQLE